jgi:putative ABC transport system permease protein
MKSHQQHSTWQIVGIVREPVAPPLAYVTYSDFARITDANADAQSLYVVTEQHSEMGVQAVQQQLEDAFDANNITITSNQTSFTTREIIENHTVLMTSFLMLAALMSLMVGGLGLMTTMSLNVLERTREIGVMRAIGASNNSLLKIILTEGLLIGGFELAVGSPDRYPHELHSR